MDTTITARRVRTRALPFSLVALAAALVLGAPDAVRADPPCWAPAHGYRAKHGDDCDGRHHEKKHRRKREHERDYRQQRDHDGDRGDYRTSSRDEPMVRVGGLAGAAVGGYVGSRFGSGDGKLAATAAGAVGGYILGSQIERDTASATP